MRKDARMNRFTHLRDKILPSLRPYVKRIAVFGSFGLGWFGLEDELSRMLGREVELIAEGSLSPYLRPYAEKDLVMLYEEG